VAARLRLDRRTVESIEIDDYRALPEPTFVRGYLRGYARLLDLPPGPIVEAYDRLGFAPPGLVADISSRPQVRSTDAPVRLVTYAVVGALVALGVLWWQSEKTPAPVPLDRIGRDVAVTASPTAEGAATLASAERARSGPAEGAAAPPPPPAAPVPTTPAAPPASAPAAGAASPAPPAPPASPTTAAGATAPATAGGTPPATSPPPAKPAPAPSEGNRLVLRLKHDSWVEIYDRDGKRLYFSLARAGQSLALSGAPPFRVILGYARDAEVEYNGQPFDPSPHISKDIARFTVGG
jgi:cytoskeleton protein RodZ